MRELAIILVSSLASSKQWLNEVLLAAANFKILNANCLVRAFNSSASMT